MKEVAKTEQEMRDSKVPWPQTIEELTEYINSVLGRDDHDYGTCVYAMSMAAVATFYYVSHMLGVTGFQASCADMDFLRRTRGYESGFRLTNYDDLLYPQYLNKEHFPSHKELLMENLPQLARKAQRLLQENMPAHPEVKARWEYIVSLANAKGIALNEEE